MKAGRVADGENEWRSKVAKGRREERNGEEESNVTEEKNEKQDRRGEEKG